MSILRDVRTSRLSHSAVTTSSLNFVAFPRTMVGVLIVDDLVTVRDSFAVMLDLDLDISDIGAADNGHHPRACTPIWNRPLS